MKTLSPFLPAVIFLSFFSPASADSWESLPFDEWEDKLPRSCYPEYPDNAASVECPIVQTINGFEVFFSQSFLDANSFESGGESVPFTDGFKKYLVYSVVASLTRTNELIPPGTRDVRNFNFSLYLGWDLESRYPCNSETVAACANFRGNSGWYANIGINMKTWYGYPAVIMHEIAHVWHRTGVPRGEENSCIRYAFEASVDPDYPYYNSRGLWRETQIHHSVTNIPIDDVYQSYDLHYATVDHSEWFAEISARYLAGPARTYPFDRYDLLDYDPLAYNVAKYYWDSERYSYLASLRCTRDTFK